MLQNLLPWQYHTKVFMCYSLFSLISPIWIIAEPQHSFTCKHTDTHWYVYIWPVVAEACAPVYCIWPRPWRHWTPAPHSEHWAHHWRWCLSVGLLVKAWTLHSPSPKGQEQSNSIKGLELNMTELLYSTKHVIVINKKLLSLPCKFIWY